MQVLTATLKVLHDHAKETEPVKMGQLKELITEVRYHSPWNRLCSRTPIFDGAKAPIFLIRDFTWFGVEQGFDSETIWQQIELRNPAVTSFIKRVTDRLAEIAERGVSLAWRK